MTIYRFYKRHQLMPIQAGILLTCLFLPVWYRFPRVNTLGMGDFSTFYSAGFVIFWPMLWTVIWWAVSGFAGIRRLWGSPVARAWFILCLIFAGWILLSWVWSYKRDSYPSATLSAAVPFILVILFVLAVVCSEVPIQWIGAVVVVGLGWNSLVAAVQVALQAPIGLSVLGEFRFNPAVSGTVVVQAGDIRWLRPYGLLPHPNMLAGFLMMALSAAFVWVCLSSRRYWWLMLGLLVFGFWALLLTFSRSAWLGFGASIVVMVLASFRVWRVQQSIMIRGVFCLGVLAITLGVFWGIYQPFLAARAGVGEEPVEQRSTSDRAVYNQIAGEAIRQSPILGLGIGNYPWYAAKYLSKTGFDLKGQPVHNIYLSAWSELGVIGLGLFGVTVLMGIRQGIQNLRRSESATQTFYYAAGMGMIAAFLVIGLFDHYTWTIIQFQAAFWGTMAVVVRPPLSQNG